jgi:hypothetical protein
MTDRTRLLTSSAEAEIINYLVDTETSTTRDYGSIQSTSEGSQPEEMDDNKTTLKFFEKIGFSLGSVFEND